MDLCACGSGKIDAECCERFISGKEIPATPEELMRSRYTAYTKANVKYIAETMRSPAADYFDAEGAKQWAERVRWIKLEVVDSSTEGDKGFVEFLAHFYQDKHNHINQRHALHERSEFHRIDGKWYYVDGIDPRANIPIKVTQIGRNDPCMCGSGKKYKKCCGNLDILSKANKTG